MFGKQNKLIMEEIIKFRGWKIELRALWSNEKSFFSKKRIESNICFLSVIITYLIWFFVNVKTMTATEFSIASALVMAYGGYTTNQIQKEKKLNKEL